MTAVDDLQKEGFFYIAGPALMAGAAQAVLFNPFDRALYVRVKFRRRFFLDRRNFQQPFQGFMNAAAYRTLLGGSYMFFQDYSRIFIDNYLPDRVHASRAPQFNAFLIGAIAGSLNGAMLNGMQVVKYRMWSTQESTTFLNVTRDMYRERGPRIFLRGIGATALRDCVFGIVYETVRRATVFKSFLDGYVQSTEKRVQEWNEAQSPRGKSGDVCDRHGCRTCNFISNLTAALLASVLSSPFNYVRTIIYGVPSGSEPMRYGHLLHAFVFQARFIYRNGESFTDVKAVDDVDALVRRQKQQQLQQQQLQQLKERRVARAVRRVKEMAAERRARRGRHPMAVWKWMNSRLNIGWGSARVGLGMAVSQSLFHFTQDLFRGER